MKAKDAKFLVPVILVSLVLRAFRIGAQSLWVDEILTLEKTIPKPGLTIWDYLFYNLQGPLHSFVVWCIHFVSSSDAWLRLRARSQAPPRCTTSTAGRRFGWAGRSLASQPSSWPSIRFTSSTRKR